MPDTGRLSTHVLDVSRGLPAAGIEIVLLTGGKRLTSAVTNGDGRTDVPLVAPGELTAATYELRFEVLAYLARTHPDESSFLDVVPVRFTVSDPTRDHHVPLLLAPWSYSVYRGS